MKTRKILKLAKEASVVLPRSSNMGGAARPPDGIKPSSVQKPRAVPLPEMLVDISGDEFGGEAIGFEYVYTDQAVIADGSEMTSEEKTKLRDAWGKKYPDKKLIISG